VELSLPQIVKKRMVLLIIKMVDLSKEEFRQLRNINKLEIVSSDSTKLAMVYSHGKLILKYSLILFQTILINNTILNLKDFQMLKDLQMTISIIMETILVITFLETMKKQNSEGTANQAMPK
jgi:hypothetical protein